MNKALRTQDIDNIFKFRFFIKDLQNQIESLYRKYLLTYTGGHLKLYRGQFISMNEIEVLKKNIQEIIAMNTFLSTSASIDVAQRFFNTDDSVPDNPSEQSVLFIIDINGINEDTTPFAFIAEYACNPEESEVLFTINALFQVISVERQGRIWHVNLQLAQHRNEEQKNLVRYMDKAVGSEPSPTVFGWFLYRMRDFERAKRYVDHITKQQLLERAEETAAYNLLGLIHHDCKDYLNAIECFEKAIHIYDDSERVGGPQIISIYHNLCLAHLANKDPRSAEDMRRRADELLPLSTVKDPLVIAISNQIRGKIDAAHGNYAKAIESLEMALTRKKTELPPYHPSIATTYHAIGVIYAKMDNDAKALENLKKAVEIGVTSLSADDFDLAEYHADLARILYKQKDYTLALEQFEIALKIITDPTREDDDIITDLLKCIKDIKDIIEPLAAEKPKQ